MTTQNKAIDSRFKLSILDMAMIGVCVALMAICAWITIPIPGVPFTLQTFAIFFAVALLGGARGTMAVFLYILIGAIGVPVFAGFKGGLGTLFGMTGGYILGFIFSALIMWAFEKLFKKSTAVLIISMIVGLIVCYTFGTIWFIVVYNSTNGPISVLGALGMCVFPFIIPDGVKIALAIMLSKPIKRAIHID